MVMTIQEEHPRRLSLEPQIIRSAVVRASKWSYQNQGEDWSLQDHGVNPGGKYQSPVDIPARSLNKFYPRVKNHVPSIIINCNTAPSAYTLTHKRPNIIQITANKPLGNVIADGKVYEAIEFHFHAPAEHTIDGNRHALEMHIAHKFRGLVGFNGLIEDDSGVTQVADDHCINHKDEFLVIGVTFAEDPNAAQSDFLQRLIDIDDFPLKPGESKSISSLPPTVADGQQRDPLFDYRSLLCKSEDKKLQLYRYAGSLTTPPCSEVVNWFVVADPVAVPDYQLAPFRMSNSYRCIQAQGVPTKTGDLAVKDKKPFHRPVATVVGYVEDASSDRCDLCGRRGLFHEERLV